MNNISLQVLTEKDKKNLRSRMKKNRFLQFVFFGLSGLAVLSSFFLELPSSTEQYWFWIGAGVGVGIAILIGRRNRDVQEDLTLSQKNVFLATLESKKIDTKDSGKKEYELGLDGKAVDDSREVFEQCHEGEVFVVEEGVKSKVLLNVVRERDGLVAV